LPSSIFVGNLFTLDNSKLLGSDGFEAAFTGCDVVMQVASPFVLDVENPQRDLVDPAVIGTRNVLDADEEVYSPV